MDVMTQPKAGSSKRSLSNQRRGASHGRRATEWQVQCFRPMVSRGVQALMSHHQYDDSETRRTGRKVS